MTDDTLVNGLKAIFGTSAQVSAPASSALIPYMDASGNPVGLSSMANLASVLGEVVNAYQSVDDVNAVGWFYTSSLDFGYMFKYNANNYFQLVSKLKSGTSDLEYVKARRKASGSWGNWMSLDNFGANTPSDLASLLGGNVNGVIRWSDSNHDLNNFKDNGRWAVWGISGAEGNQDHMPVTGTDNSRGFLDVTKVSESANVYWIIQEYYETFQNANKKYIRTFINDQWSSWKTIVS